MKVVIRAPSRPPCAGTLEWFESRPDIPGEIAAQTPSSSSQSATNSRIAALPLKIVIWTGERDGELGVWRGPAGWRMNDRGVEAEQERRVVLFHSISSHNVITAAQRKRSPAGMWVRNLSECFPRERERERAREKEWKRTLKNVHMWVCPCACMSRGMEKQTVISKTMCQLTRGNTHSTVLRTFFRPGPLFIFPAVNGQLGLQQPP